MKKYIIISAIFLLAAGCKAQQQVINYPPPVEQSKPPVATTTPEEATSTPLLLPLKYNNTQYGFIFSLPETWLGYSIVYDVWTGDRIDSAGREYPAEAGALFRIRHP